MRDTIWTLLAAGLALACGSGSSTPPPPPTVYALTLSPGSSGLLVADPAGPTYSPGTVVKLTAVADPQFKVAGWSGTDDDTITGPVNHVTMSADKTVAANFTPLTQQTFTLTLAPGAHGTLTSLPAGPSYADGTTVSLTAVAETGYRLESWHGTDDDALATATNTVTMTSSRTVSATFALVPAQQFTLTLSVPGGNGAIAAAPAGPSYPAGTVVSLTPRPAVGYWLASWSGTDHDASTNNATNTVTMTSDKSVSAKFEVTSTTCPVDPVTGNAAARIISPPNGATLPAGAVTFEWCNAGADYFLTVERIPGAHDVFFAFAGGPGAGVESITLGPACQTPTPTNPTTGCIVPDGKPVYLTLMTLKSKQNLPPSPFSYTFTAASAP